MQQNMVINTSFYYKLGPQNDEGAFIGSAMGREV